ncbi:ribosomal protein S5 domain 2-type protein [Podospora conica]|nr:ribosomal protein S5 domain 2-type protein [Schizothecium conicum]
MSEALADEVSAINSIYGDSTLVKSDDQTDVDADDGMLYILTLPSFTTTVNDNDDGRGSSLRLLFSPAYPDEPPAVLGVHSLGSHAKRGAAARDLAQFRRAVGDVYDPGAVCLFDAIERTRELCADDDESAAAADAAAPTKPEPEPADDDDDDLGEEPPWALSLPLVESKSTFVARCCPVADPARAAACIRHLLATDRRVRAATHNITAWRIRGSEGVVYQDCDDDGETAAGGRLLHLMQVMGIWDVVVVVTRWYGGVKLGPKRFAMINAAARDAFVRAGIVVEEGGGTGKRKGR